MIKTVLADIRLPQDAERALVQSGYGVLRLPPFPVLSAPVASHPDMLLFAVPHISDGDGQIARRGKIFCHERYYEIAKEQFREIGRLGYEVITTSQPMSGKYPGDILFNCAIVGGKLIANARHASRRVLGYAAQAGIEIVNVRQGYAKCSVCVVSEDALITADDGIAAAARAAGISVLHLPEISAKLIGYEKGFIGGASGLDGKTLFFTGALSSAGEENAARVRDFCAALSVRTVSLSDEPLYDFGSLIFI